MKSNSLKKDGTYVLSRDCLDQGQYHTAAKVSTDLSTS